LAHKPAPIQVHYLGFPGSTGASYVDYLITDTQLTPPSLSKYFSEKLIFLPNCYQINPCEKINPNHFTRKQLNLPSNGIVFCSFNQPKKINSSVFDVWLQLLHQIPNSVLWLVENESKTSQICKQYAKNKGVAPHRLIFAPYMGIKDNLDRLALADIALDPFIHSGGATTTDALLAGVPVITKTGHRYCTRMSTSILHCLGLTECIATTTNEYIRCALTLATDLQKRNALKTKIKQAIITSPLYQPELHTHYLESAYHSIWLRYQQHRPSISLEIPSK
jgi:predicted O-linked N-acetylglucosamine transferase (SPINDLY family)